MLDMRTVLILTTVYGCVAGTGMIVLNIRKDTAKGIRLIGVGVLFYTIGFILIALRNIIPDTPSIVLGNLGVLAGLMFILDGFTVFKGFRSNWFYQNIILLTLTAVSFYLFSLKGHENYTSLRILLITVFSTIILMELLYMALKNLTPITRKGSMVLILYQCSSIVVSIIRCYITLRDDPLFSFMDAGFIHVLTIIMFQLLPFVYIIGTYMISNAIMQQDLLELNMIDSLTGLYNRGAILELAEKEIAKCNRKDCTTGICMCDLDHFKEVNDTYGHLVGDRTLKHVAELLKDNLRIGDYIGRYGGEEFVIIMNCISESDASKRMESLRSIIEENPLTIHDFKLPITASFGAFIISEGIELQSALRQADKAMYQAKNTGRNRVVVTAPQE